MVGLNSLFTKCYRVELFPPYFPLKKSSFTKETNVEKTFQYKIWSQARTQNLSILCLSQEYYFVHLALVMSSYLSTSFPLCLCQTRKWQKILNVLIPFSGMEIQLKCFDKALFKAAMILVEFLAKQNLTNSPNRCRPTSLIKIITASSIFPSYTF